MKRALLPLIFVGGLFFVPSSRGQAVVTWGSALNIAGNTDVVTAGPLVRAFTIGSSDVSPASVNSVTFEAFGIGVDPNPTSVTVGNFTLAESVTALAGSNFLGGESGSFAALSLEYQSMLGSGGYATEENFQTITLTLGNLTPGQGYRFQWWINNSSSSTGYSTTATAGNAVTLSSNTADLYGGLGQYALGTFTAVGTGQTIDFVGIGAAPLINAFQLREIAAVPEPATATGFAGLAVVGFALRRRRRAKRA